MFHKYPHYLQRLINRGAKTQLTAGSFFGDYGKNCCRCAMDMLINGTVHCIASDMHPGRKYRMAEMKKKVAKILSPSQAEAIFGLEIESLVFANGKKSLVV